MCQLDVYPGYSLITWTSRYWWCSLCNIRQSTGLWSPRWFQTYLMAHDLRILSTSCVKVNLRSCEVISLSLCGPYSCWILWIHGASQICHTKAYATQVGITIINYMLYNHVFSLQKPTSPKRLYNPTPVCLLGHRHLWFPFVPQAYKGNGHDCFAVLIYRFSQGWKRSFG